MVKIKTLDILIFLLLMPHFLFAQNSMLRLGGGLTGRLVPPKEQMLSPDEFFGFELTSDRVLADYSQLLEYYKYIASKSKNVLLENVGHSTEGRDMYQLIVSSKKNIRNLDHILSNQKKLANPRMLSENEAESIIDSQPIIIFVGLSIHANEITATQMAPSFIYELLNIDSANIDELLDRIVFVMSIAINPDGIDSVTHWYWDTLNTPAEGTTPPYLYQKYAGHDNNRDYFMNNLRETRVWSVQLFKRLYPVIVYDVHEMGPTGPRFFVPPFHDPANPAIPSTTIRDIELIGGAVSSHLAEVNLPGVVTNGIYDMWWHGGLRPTPNFHNQIGILTEAARVDIATPIYVSFDDLIGRLGIPSTKDRYINFTDVWEGGNWHSKDIATYEKETLKSLIEVSIKYRKDLIRRFYERNVNAIKAGQNTSPYGYIFNIDENDASRLITLMEVLNFQGIEIQALKSPLNVEGENYPPNSFIIFLSQQQRQNILALLEKQTYPPRFLYPGGPPEPPYDIASWNLLQQMDIKANILNQPFPEYLKENLVTIEPDLENFTTFVDTIKNRRITFNSKLEKSGLSTIGHVIGMAGKDGGYIFSTYNNNYAIILNRLLKNGIDIYRTVRNVRLLDKVFPKNSYVIPYNDDLYETLEELASELSINIYGLGEINNLTLQPLKKKKIALYESYNANYPTGWVSFVLDVNEFEYDKIHNNEIRSTNLKEEWDVIIFGSESYSDILNGENENYPESYRGGIGSEGLESLKSFANDGGVLILIDRASDVAIKGFDVPVINILEEVPEEEFYCPGSILNLIITNPENPLFAGYSSHTFSYFKHSPTFEVLDDRSNILAVWPDKGSEILASGWIEGEELIAGKAAVVDVPIGKGHIILTAFDVVHRGQPHATFKLLFNAIFADLNL